MDRILKELIERGTQHANKCPDRTMMCSYFSMWCHCGFYIDIDMIKEALRYAEKYKTNTNRIKKLLDLMPETSQNGKVLYSKLTNDDLITMRDDSYPLGYIINPDIL